jgi:hypothetical protein
MIFHELFEAIGELLGVGCVGLGAAAEIGGDLDHFGQADFVSARADARCGEDDDWQAGSRGETVWSQGKGGGCAEELDGDGVFGVAEGAVAHHDDDAAGEKGLGHFDNAVETGGGIDGTGDLILGNQLSFAIGERDKRNGFGNGAEHRHANLPATDVRIEQNEAGGSEGKLDDAVVIGAEDGEGMAAENLEGSHVHERDAEGADEAICVEKAADRAAALGEAAIQIETAAAANGGVEEDVPEGNDVGDVIGGGFSKEADQPVEESLLPFFSNALGGPNRLARFDFWRGGSLLGVWVGHGADRAGNTNERKGCGQEEGWLGNPLRWWGGMVRLKIALS